MSLVLRHKPENFGLRLDPFGFVDLSDLLAVLQNRYGNVDLSDIERVVKNCPQSILRAIRAKSPENGTSQGSVGFAPTTLSIVT